MICLPYKDQNVDPFQVLFRCFESHPGNICPSFKTHMWWLILFGTVFMLDYYSEKESDDPKIWMYLICTT